MKRSEFIKYMALVFGLFAELNACSAQSNSTVFKEFIAKNRVKIEYAVYLPKDYQPSNEYVGTVLFSEMVHNKETAERLIENLTSEKNEGSSYILIVPLAPIGGRNGWINHPAHHALEDFLDHINSKHNILNDQFMNVGYLNGTVPAYIWMNMSNKYFNSLILASCYEFNEDDIKSLDKIVSWQKPFTLITSLNDKDGLKQASLLENKLKGMGSKFQSLNTSDKDKNLQDFTLTRFSELINEKAEELKENLK